MIKKTIGALALLLASTVASAQGVVSFIIDDSYKSAYDVARPLFNEYNVKAGFAITGGTMQQDDNYALGLTHRRLGYMVAGGHEVLNHGGKHRDLRPATTTVATCQLEMTAPYDVLTVTKYSYTIHGWATPYSTMTEHCVPVVAERHQYGFTVANTETGAGAVMQPGIDPYRLWRTGLYTAGVAGAKATIDAVAESGGLVVFYDHDLSRLVYPSSSTPAQVRQVIEYAISKGVQILPPTEALYAAGILTN